MERRLDGASGSPQQLSLRDEGSPSLVLELGCVHVEGVRGVALFMCELMASWRMVRKQEVMELSNVQQVRK
jgi:hypothetical protein